MGKKSPKPIAVRRPTARRGGRPLLSRQKALAALAKGATAAGVGRAAGSRARTRRALAEVGRRIIRQLRQRGEILETFADLGYDVRRFCEHIVQRLEACEVKVGVRAGKFIYSRPLIDWATRAQAAEQYMRATGITTLPLEAAPEAPGALAGVPDALVAELAELLAAE